MSRQMVSLIMMSMMGVATSASAAVITKINGNRVLVSGPELATAHSTDRIMVGQNCELTIVKISGTKLVADSGACQDQSFVKVGAMAALAVGTDATANEVAQADAAGHMSTRMYDPYADQYSPMLMKGFGVGLMLNTVQRKGTEKWTTYQNGYAVPVNYYGQTEQHMDDNGNGTKGGANLNYSWVPRSGFGFMADVTIGQVDHIISPDAYTFVRPAANVVFGAPETFYGYAGANYMAFTASPTYQGDAYKGQSLPLKTNVGWQVGAGAVFQKNFQAQLQYTDSSVAIDTNVQGQGYYAMYSQHIQATYEFQGVEAVLAYRF